MSVSVLIPTFRRPDGLARALASVIAQSRLPDEIVVVDNAPEGGMRAVSERFQARTTIPIIHLHVPEPGIANARNAGFAAAKSRFIAQLDDDETASAVWLEALMTTREQLDTPIVFGPVTAEASSGNDAQRAYMTRLYSRQGPDKPQALTKPAGAGNSLIDRVAVPLPALPFDVATNETGGEDDDLFAKLQRTGVRFGWAPDAKVIEHVDGRRSQWRYLMLRSFSYGQGASHKCLVPGALDLPKLLYWMLVGGAQACVYGLALLPAWVVGPSAFAACLDRMTQGLGKLFWMPVFSPRFYGAARL